ncbi:MULTISPECIES: LytR/AlgR family response regulator transcription factor [Salegentibacter]|uniref:LytR/AlgR family response regulator transcription factor n=1 Tax=Salegentibacter TaxID=143222 RepID=UPI00187BA7E4|nr:MULTISPECIES: LytTR family DNA-binding domain-containing protein [Salegentibacter]MBE7641696.1 response regulator [Salegentibacter sp. BLCTC]MBI6117248.1 response regulator transcription factor [Salegentibacter maritimus]
MEVVIIEDEELAADSLESLLLKTHYNLSIKKKLGSVEQALEWFKNNTCDLIFSDISLGDGESFEIFEILKIDIPIIFTTAFNQYAIQSFQFNAIDYLLKPYEKEKLNRALEKFFSYKNQTSSASESKNELDNLIAQLKIIPEINQKKTRFLVSKGEELVSISSEDIAYFMAENKSLFLCKKDGEIFLYDDTISNLEKKLDLKDFFKINRKFIVQHNAIKSIVKYSQNRLKLELHPLPNTQDPVLISAKNIQSFKSWLNN